MGPGMMHRADGSADADGVVRLEVPAHATFLRLARLVAADGADRLGFDFERVEDVRIAVDELCSALLAHARERIEIEVETDGGAGALVIAGRSPCAGPPGPVTVSPLAATLLRSVVDQWTLDQHGDEMQFRFVARHRP